MSRRAQTVVRRFLDMAFIVVAAPLWVPIWALCATAIVLDSGPPILYRQDRVGRHGVAFTMLKFRSMVRGENPLVPDASRITRVGAHLRRTSLDELPQLINVLRGEMSLVGPRPILPQQVAVMTDDQKRRHRVRPGLTGLSQINGRNTIAWRERFAHDCRWADAPTIASYLSILARTARVVSAGDGVDGHDAADPLLVDLTASRDAAVDLDARSETTAETV